MNAEKDAEVIAVEILFVLQETIQEKALEIVAVEESATLNVNLFAHGSAEELVRALVEAAVPDAAVVAREIVKGILHLQALVELVRIVIYTAQDVQILVMGLAELLVEAAIMLAEAVAVNIVRAVLALAVLIVLVLAAGNARGVVLVVLKPALIIVEDVALAVLTVVAQDVLKPVVPIVFIIAVLLVLVLLIQLNKKKERIVLNDNFKRFTNTK